MSVLDWNFLPLKPYTLVTLNQRLLILDDSPIFFAVLKVTYSAKGISAGKSCASVDRECQGHAPFHQLWREMVAQALPRQRIHAR